MTDIFLDNFFPQNNQPEYHHFTSFAAFENIIKNKSIWLTSVAKRFGEKEFKPFYSAHKMDGYEKRKNHLGEPLEKFLVENAFYISLTHKNINRNTTAHLWSAFSKGRGARLVFEISNIKTHLRKVYYPKNQKETEIPLLKEFIEIVQKHENKYLIIEGISTIGFFYLPCILNIEQEYRMLIKRYSAENYNLKFGHSGDGYEYIEFPLFENPIANIKLIKVFVDNKDAETAKKILMSNPLFSSVIVENNS